MQDKSPIPSIPRCITPLIAPPSERIKTVYVEGTGNLEGAWIEILQDTDPIDIPLPTDVSMDLDLSKYEISSGEEEEHPLVDIEGLAGCFQNLDLDADQHPGAKLSEIPLPSKVCIRILNVRIFFQIRCLDLVTRKD